MLTPNRVESPTTARLELLFCSGFFGGAVLFVEVVVITPVVSDIT